MHRPLFLLSLLGLGMIVPPSHSPGIVSTLESTPFAADAVECRPRGGLPNFFKKAEAGEEVHIAYLGGSITEAAGWRVLSLNWLRKQYPKADIREINAAISGTGSDFGVFRVEREVLRKNPDLLFVEFATNDFAARPDRIIKAMEGIVRKTRRSNPHTDICFVYTVSEQALPVLQSGKFQETANAMEQVANQYGVASVHMGLEVARLAKEGKLIFKGALPKTDEEKAALGGKIVFTGDGIHPHAATGHPLYLAAIERSLPSLKAASDRAQQQQPLPAPLDAQNWERATLVPFESIQRTGDWRPLDPAADAAKQTAKMSGNRWVASTPGASLSFRFTGTAFGIYSIKGPDLGTFSVTVDDGQPLVTTLFDCFCVAKRYRIKPWVYPGALADGEHRVKIELRPESPNKTAILGKKGIAADPAQFEGTKFYIGDVMVVGEVK